MTKSLVFAGALFLATGCRTPAGGADVAPRATPEPAPTVNVVAVVDKIEGNGYQDLMTDGSVISWTLVTFMVARPEAAWGTVVRAYCAGHPFLGGAPLLIGQAVTFDLPPPVQREGIALEQPPQLQRAQ